HGGRAGRQRREGAVRRRQGADVHHRRLRRGQAARQALQRVAHRQGAARAPHGRRHRGVAPQRVQAPPHRHPDHRRAL
ncbi:MAG: Transcription elongation factor GreA, partial [uncultured Solirubrobacteraceae bacterium]